MLQTFRAGILAGAVAVSMMLPATGHAQQFDDAQRGEIGSIIRDYLMKNPEVLRDAFEELQRAAGTAPPRRRSKKTRRAS